MCVDEVDAAYVDAIVSLDPSARPWERLLVWETIVDGAPYAPSGSYSPESGYGLPEGYVSDAAGSWLGRGIDRVYATCAGLPANVFDEGVEPGIHEVSFRAHLPGTDIALETGVAAIDLVCFVGHDPRDVCPGGVIAADTGECTYPEGECPSGSTWHEGECRYSMGVEEPGGSGLFWFGCSASGATGASRGGAFGFGLLVVGAVFALRRRRQR